MEKSKRDDQSFCLGQTALRCIEGEELARTQVQRSRDVEDIEGSITKSSGVLFRKLRRDSKHRTHVERSREPNTAIEVVLKIEKQLDCCTLGNALVRVCPVAEDLVLNGDTKFILLQLSQGDWRCMPCQPGFRTRRLLADAVKREQKRTVRRCDH